MSGNAIYQGLEEFYGANPERQQSGEAGYGVHWRQDGDRERWRVSYVRDTQEVYAVRLGGHGPGQGIVEVLGTFPADEDAGEFGIYYQGLEAHLDGWAVRCILPGSLGWIRERMELAGCCTEGPCPGRPPTCWAAGPSGGGRPRCAALRRVWSTFPGTRLSSGTPG